MKSRLRAALEIYPKSKCPKICVQMRPKHAYITYTYEFRYLAVIIYQSMSACSCAVRLTPMDISQSFVPRAYIINDKGLNSVLITGPLK